MHAGLRRRLDLRPGLSVSLRPHLPLSLSLSLGPRWSAFELASASEPEPSEGLSARLSLYLGMRLRPSRRLSWRPSLRPGQIGV